MANNQNNKNKYLDLILIDLDQNFNHLRHKLDFEFTYFQKDLENKTKYTKKKDLRELINVMLPNNANEYNHTSDF